MKKLKLTNDACLLINQILSMPGVASTPIEILKTGRLMECFDVKRPDKFTKEWLDKETEIEIKEDQLSILKNAITKTAEKLPTNKTTISIITQLGFSE